MNNESLLSFLMTVSMDSMYIPNYNTYYLKYCLFKNFGKIFLFALHTTFFVHFYRGLGIFHYSQIIITKGQIHILYAQEIIKICF